MVWIEVFHVSLRILLRPEGDSLCAQLSLKRLRVTRKENCGEACRGEHCAHLECIAQKTRPVST